MNRHAAWTLALAGLVVLVPSCKKKEAPPAEPAATQPAPPAPLAVVSVDLGKAVMADKMISAPATVFGVRDTIYASVSTSGVGENATIAARWTFVKQDGSTVPVNESSQTISTSGPAATEFHIAKASPWPKGRYAVEILLNGATAGKREFEVQ